MLTILTLGRSSLCTGQQLRSLLFFLQRARRRQSLLLSHRDDRTSDPNVSCPPLPLKLGYTPKIRTTTFLFISYRRCTVRPFPPVLRPYLRLYRVTCWSELVTESSILNNINLQLIIICDFTVNKSIVLMYEESHFVVLFMISRFPIVLRKCAW